MYQSLLKLYLIAAILQAGISLTEIQSCSGKGCLGLLERAKAKILKIEWKPIEVFPQEAKRFR